jgi:CRP-like cAMP-binding protein
MYFVQAGEFRSVVNGHCIRTVTAGDIFGEVSLLRATLSMNGSGEPPPFPRLASVEASPGAAGTRSECLELSWEALTSALVQTCTELEREQLLQRIEVALEARGSEERTRVLGVKMLSPLEKACSSSNGSRNGVVSNGPAVLSSQDLFDCLSNRSKADNLKAMRARTYSDGEMMFRQGEVGSQVYFVEEGCVELRLAGGGGGGGGGVLKTVTQGGAFGEIEYCIMFVRA